MFEVLMPETSHPFCTQILLSSVIYYLCSHHNKKLKNLMRKHTESTNIDMGQILRVSEYKLFSVKTERCSYTKYLKIFLNGKLIHVLKGKSVAWLK